MTSPARRRAIVMSVAGLAGATALVALSAPAGSATPEPSTSFSSARTAVTGYLVAEAGATTVTLDVVGAIGQGGPCDRLGGYGGEVIATIPVAPGEVLQYNIGNSIDTNPASGNSSDVRRSPYGLADRVIVAGGGGYAADHAGLDIGGGCNGLHTGPGIGGAGGDLTGVTGNGEVGCTYPGGSGGGGGTQDAGGGGGAVCGGGASGLPGSFGAGGAYGFDPAAKAPCSFGGYGGSGWYGGGGGATTASSDPESPGGCTDKLGNSIAPTIGGGGGGGSSYVEPAATGVVFHAGVNDNYIGAIAATTGDFPTVTGVSPKAGPLGGGRTVTVVGTHFTGTSTVTFGGTAGSHVTVDSATRLTVRTPAHVDGTVHVRVTTPTGTSPSVAADRYAYLKAPAVTALSPRSGPPRGGRTITVTGRHFTLGATVLFGSTRGTRVTVTSGTTLTVRAPAHARGRVDVRVTTPGGRSATVRADRYTYR
jgi:IPT/TIG domain